MEDFATYLLNEKDVIQKMVITYYLSKKTGIFFDKSIVLKTEITKMFIDFMELDVDCNTVTTAMLLCNCKKIENAQKIGKLETYAMEGAEYLSTIGFSDRFCDICRGVNRYNTDYIRLKESDILELVDQFVGLILNRVEREAFSPTEALVILKERNLKYADNQYLDKFIFFVEEMENVNIHEMIDVPVIKKLVNLHNKEANVKTYIAALGNDYIYRIKDALDHYNKKEYKESVEKEKEKKAKNEEKIIANNKERALFNEEIANRIMNHESVYKVEE